MSLNTTIALIQKELLWEQVNNTLQSILKNYRPSSSILNENKFNKIKVNGTNKKINSNLESFNI